MRVNVRPWIVLSLAVIVCCVAAVTAVIRSIAPRCDELVQYRTSSPDARWVAESNVEGCWGGGSTYVTLHPSDAKQNINERIVGFDDTYSDGYTDVILHWIDNDHLEIGLPIESNAMPGPSEFQGIYLSYSFFPNDAEELRERSEFLDKKLTLQAWIKYRDSRVESIANLATQVDRVVPTKVTYAFTEQKDASGLKWCYLNGLSVDGVFFKSVEMQLVADVEPRNVAAFQVQFKASEPLGDRMKSLFLTGAQFVGSSFANNPARVFRERAGVSFFFLTDRQLMNFLASFKKGPYLINLVFDLPERIIQYEIPKGPKSELMASFFACVGQAKSFGRIASDLNLE